MIKRLIIFFLGLGLIVGGVPAYAILSIEITQSLESGLPIAIVPFKREGGPASGQLVSQIVETDLLRSGRFSSISSKNFLSTPHQQSEVIFKDWRLIKAEALVTGRVQTQASGRVQVDFQLYDVFREKRLANYRYVAEPSQLRTVAHQISDIIYEKLTGERGVFNTRIAYISREVARPGFVFKLQVSDSDGYNERTILSSSEPLMSPAWSPDGNRLAYVSFEQKRSMVYIQNIADGKRIKIAESKGINSAPAWSPDGGRLALVLSREGNPEIYLLNLADQKLQRLTQNPAIDTEPAWSPDGREIIFTSDRSGGPQIYRMAANGGNATRLTFEGNYNARASYSSDGKMITLVSRYEDKYHAAILNLTNSSLQILTETSLDESPSFAPNGRIILYATEVKGRGVLASVSSDGRVRQLLKLQEGDIREPAWSPFTSSTSTQGAIQ
jgi:TolB protein